ncbi:hypothetical protein STEG23_006899, partial [Scotinomys teguina]
YAAEGQADREPSICMLVYVFLFESSEHLSKPVWPLGSPLRNQHGKHHTFLEQLNPIFLITTKTVNTWKLSNRNALEHHCYVSNFIFDFINLDDLSLPFGSNSSVSTWYPLNILPDMILKKDKIALPYNFFKFHIDD